MPVFKTGALNRSATHPSCNLNDKRREGRASSPDCHPIATLLVADCSQDVVDAFRGLALHAVDRMGVGSRRRANEVARHTRAGPRPPRTSCA